MKIILPFAIATLLLLSASCSPQSKTAKTAPPPDAGHPGQAAGNSPAGGGGPQAAEGLQTPVGDVTANVHAPQKSALRTGAEQTHLYLDLLKNKKVALVVNQTSTIGEKHLVDYLQRKNVGLVKVFAPEHGFRGMADAGEAVRNSTDVKSGLPIVSLYGSNKKPTPEQLHGVDVVVFDIQDVGARFYTYISTMHYVMEACAENGIPLVVLDRPNPNGHYVDGPVLQPGYQSFVGMHPIPIVHGMTVGELAKMINGEGWLKNGIQCELAVVPCAGYTHATPYELPVRPSPNLPNARSIYLYPSLCLFEGTAISVGRGTDKQFQVIGHPDLENMPYQFTPQGRFGAKHPLYENKTCSGYDMTSTDPAGIRAKGGLDLHWLLEMYAAFPEKGKFFLDNGFFDKLAGSGSLQHQVKAGLDEESIRATWQTDLQGFKQKRKAYLLYPDFE